MLWVAFCIVISWEDVRKYKNLAQFNTDWLASLRTWYYFSFSRSGYDLTVIKSRQTWNCYSLFWNFLLKTQIYKFLVGAAVTQCTTKTKYLKKAIYFFSIMCYSTNHLNTTCYSQVKVLYFAILRRKKFFCFRKWWGEGLALPLGPPSPQCLWPWCVRVFFYKVADLQACNFIKERLHHRCFPVNIANFLRNPILKNIFKQRLLFLKQYTVKVERNKKCSSGYFQFHSFSPNFKEMLLIESSSEK